MTTPKHVGFNISLISDITDKQQGICTSENKNRPFREMMGKLQNTELS